jgi:hypothetical protein
MWENKPKIAVDSPNNRAIQPIYPIRGGWLQLLFA